jgi:hypothetical protein
MSKTKILGIKIISILMIFGAVILALLGIFMIFASNLAMSLIPNFAQTYGTMLRGFQIFGGILALVVSVVGVYIGMGLWNIKKWARLAVVILNSLGLIMSLGSLFQVVGTAQLIAEILLIVIQASIIAYLLLNKKVKAEFA